MEHVRFNAVTLYRLLNTFHQFYIYAAKGKCLNIWLMHHMSKMF